MIIYEIAYGIARRTDRAGLPICYHTLVPVQMFEAGCSTFEARRSSDTGKENRVGHSGSSASWMKAFSAESGSELLTFVRCMFTNPCKDFQSTSGEETVNDTVLTKADIMGFVASAKPDEAKKFYSETLGLELLTDNQYSLIFSVNKALTLRVQRVEQLIPQQSAVFGWRVDDIEEAVTTLSERGVKFVAIGLPSQDAHGICTFENGDKVAWFQDPDGNTLSIAQIKC